MALGGYGSSISQLCSFCDPATATPSSCCYDPSTNVGTCGYTLPALSSSSSAAVASASRASADGASATAGMATNLAKSRGLSGGAIAGIVIGSLIGLLLVRPALLDIHVESCR